MTREELARLVGSGQVLQETLVWKKGFQQWTPLRQVSELRDLQASVPPPITAGGISNTSKYDTSGKWARFFARTFDVWLEVLVVSFLLGYLLASTSSAYVEWINQPGSEYLFGIICLPIGLVLDAVLFKIAGGTPGKLMLGVRVVTPGGNPLTFEQYLGRNMAVWPSGLALGFPLINLFVMARQAGRLDKGQSASYDEKPGYRVIAVETSALRKILFFVAFFALFLLMSVLNQMDKSRDFAASAASRLPDVQWVNPDTGGLASIRAIWKPSSQPNADGQAIYMFNEAADRAAVIFAVESAPAFGISDYVSAFQAGTSDSMRFTDGGRYSVVGGRDTWVGTGTMSGVVGSRLVVEVRNVDGSFWRVVSIQTPPFSATESSVEELKAALFNTIE